MVAIPAQPAAGVPEPAQADGANPDGDPAVAGEDGRVTRATDVDAEQTVDARIAELRGRIDEIDVDLIRLWRARAAISQEVGATRIASGGTKIVLSREREVLNRFRDALGSDGTQLALLILRAGRGPL